MRRVANFAELCFLAPSNCILVVRTPVLVARSAQRSLCRWSVNMATTKPAYDRLCDQAREISHLQGVLSLLSWDQKTMMPKDAARGRGSQKAALAACIHDKSTAEELGKSIALVEKSGEWDKLDEWERAVVRDMKREYEMAVRVPKELKERMMKLEAEGYLVWENARHNNRFEDFVPVLGKLLEAAKEYAKATRPHLEPYDACIDIYERGMTSGRLERIYEEIKGPLKELLSKILGAKPLVVPEIFNGGDVWDTSGQAKICEQMSRDIGFDFDRGRLDVTVHPFTATSHPTDVRITTRYSKENPFEGVSGTVHECGHAMYEQGRNAKYDGLPVSKALSMGLHESQSLLWERHVYQSDSFWAHFTALFHRYLPGTVEASARDFYVAVNRVGPSLIRVDADEVTYPFHIILRFEIERGLMDGSIKIEDLPEVWSSKMREYLDIDVPSSSQGVLQDVHWSTGTFGYFPSYTLGAMTAAQIYATARSKISKLEEKMAEGSNGFLELRSWLNENVHAVGSLYTSVDELLEVLTGEPLNPKYYIDYLTKKYTKIYDL